MSNDITGAVLNYRITQLSIEDESETLTSQKKKVDAAQNKRVDLNKDIKKAMADAKRLQKEADDMAKKAKKTGFFGKLFGKASKRSKKAAELANKASKMSANAQKLQLALKQKAEEHRVALEKMQAALQTSETTKDTVKEFQNLDDTSQAKFV